MITPEEQNVLIIRGLIAELPEEDNLKCEALIKEIKDLLKKNKEIISLLAIGYIGTELEEAASKKSK